MPLARAIPRHPDYYVVMQSYPARYRDGFRVAPDSRQSVVDPEITRREVVARIKSGEYRNVSFIHHVRPGVGVEDVTDDIMAAASIPDVVLSPSDRLDAFRDHCSDHRKSDADVFFQIASELVR